MATAPAGVVEVIAKDALQRPLAGVRLRLEAADGRVIGTATTAADGAYRFSGIAPGVYSVVGEKEGFDTATAIVTVQPNAGETADLALASRQALDLAAITQRLEEARTSIQPRIGASTYALSDHAIQAQPGGENNSLSKTILQAPGVAQDSIGSGQFHIRNDHANVQYRINGVILPEGVSLFGQALSPRFASSVDLLTGALPAEYGLRTAGIIDIQSKSGAFAQGGSAGFYGGSHGTLQPSVEYAGSSGTTSYFFTGDYLQNSMGIESPTADVHPIHDDTEQEHAFAYVEKVIDPSSKLSWIAGTFSGHFQIPNNPDQPVQFSPVLGATDFDSRRLDENQREFNQYVVMSYLKTAEDWSAQVSTFARYSTLSFHPDPLGDLMFNGIAPTARRSNLAEGIQAESSVKAASDHTVRSGLIISREHTAADTTSSVLGIADDGTVSDTPMTVFDNTQKTAWTYSLYAQDEWRIIPTVTLNYGLRFDMLDAYTQEHQFSPRVSVVWQPWSTTTFHIGYARYFTPPPLEQVATASIQNLAGTTGAPPTTDNSVTKAERADYFDVGWLQQVIPGFRIGVDAYYKKSHNLIDEGQFGAPIILTAFNYDQARNYGAEFSASYDLGNFSAYGNFAVAKQWAKKITSAQFNFEQDELDFIASNYIPTDHSQFITASAGAAYTWEDTRFSADLIAGSGLRSGFANQDHLPFYEQVNLGVSHRFDAPAAGPIEVRADVINLFDKIYEIRDGSGVGVGAPQFGPRRAFYAGLKWEF